MNTSTEVAEGEVVIDMSEKKNSWDDKPVDVSTEVNFIWSVATLLHSVSYKDADHRDVILPMTVLRRLECALAPTKEKVVKYAEAHPNAPEAVLKNKAGMEFFNKSPWTLEKLLSVKSQVRDLKDYIAGFSSNVAEIFRCLAAIVEPQFDVLLGCFQCARRQVLILRAEDGGDFCDGEAMGFDDVRMQFDADFQIAKAGNRYKRTSCG